MSGENNVLVIAARVTGVELDSERIPRSSYPCGFGMMDGKVVGVAVGRLEADQAADEDRRQNKSGCSSQQPRKPSRHYDSGAGTHLAVLIALSLGRFEPYVNGTHAGAGEEEAPQLNSL